MSCLHCLCLFTYSDVLYILCSVFALFFHVLCTLYCRVQWIVHFGLLRRYSQTFVNRCRVSCLYPLVYLLPNTFSLFLVIQSVDNNVVVDVIQETSDAH
jgi:hypothetical protein